LEKVKDNKKKTVIYEVLTKLLPKTNEKHNNNLLKNAFDKWHENAFQLNKRENRLKNALDTITKKQLINDVNNVKRGMVLKQLFHNIPYARAKYFMEKIKNIHDKKNKYEKLVDDTLKAKEDLEDQKKRKLMTKLYKLYAYNKIDNMLKAFNNYDNKLKNTLSKELLYKLLMIKTSNSAFNYNNSITSTNQAKKTKLAFKNKVTKNNSILTDKNAPMRKVLPNLINYLQKLLNRRKQDTFDDI
jgi:hypothetical protein